MKYYLTIQAVSYTHLDVYKRQVQQEVINHSDGCIEIPQYGTKHSLNVSVTTGIVIWDLFKKLH